jgi:hypothetical protein
MNIIFYHTSSFQKNGYSLAFYIETQTKKLKMKSNEELMKKCFKILSIGNHFLHATEIG